MGLLPAPDSKRSPKISNFGHDRALSIRNITLMMTTPSNYSFEHLCYGHDPWSKSQKASKRAYHSIFNRYLFKLSFHIFWVLNLLAENTNLGLIIRWDSIFCDNSVYKYGWYSWKIAFWRLKIGHVLSCLKSEPSKSGSSSIFYALANSLHPCACLFVFFALLDFFGWPQSKLPKKFKNSSPKSRESSIWLKIQNCPILVFS
jgi:hypothetical protein